MLTRKCSVVTAIVAICAGFAGRAGAWTSPVALSDFGPESSRPRIARGAGGALQIVWLNKSEWRIYYRHRAGGGAWGPMELVSVGGLSWADRADVAEDNAGRARVVYAGSVPGGKADLYEAVKSGGSWTTTQLTNTSGTDEDYPRLAPDSLGRLHTVYVKGTTVVYRVWNGSWSAETPIGSYTGNGNPYYHRPDICVDSTDKLHVVWEPNSTTLAYRKCDGSFWGSQLTIGTTSGFLAYCAVANAGPGSIVAVTYDDNKIMCNTSSNGGASWGGYQFLNDGHYPKMDSDTFGNAHLTYEWLPANHIGYRRWNGASWTAAEIVSPYTRWQGWPDVAADTNGAAYIVYDDGDVWPQGVIQFVASQDTDYAPPAQVSPLTAAAGDGRIYLNWTNPNDPDFKGTVVRFRTSGYPTGPTDGVLVCDRPAARGSSDSFTHAGLANGQVCYYSAFTYDARPNYSSAAQAHNTPRSMSCLYAKQQPDGATVDLKDKAVTAIFAADGCIYVEEADRTSGIRVVNSGSGLAVGDRVNVSGTIGTRMLSGQASERQVTGASVTFVSAGTPLEALGMGCRSVGGAAIPPNVPGVTDGVGPNNMGLLVKISGRITGKLTSYLWVDDGSNVADPSGRTGVMIRCPGTPSNYNINDVISVAGIVGGSIYVGTATNRRSVHARSWEDITRYGIAP